jgi:hypothetical protein
MDANKNIEASIKYMGQNLKKFGGDKVLATIAYNAGPGTATSYKNDPGKILPTETQTYLKRTEQYYYVFDSDTPLSEPKLLPSIPIQRPPTGLDNLKSWNEILTDLDNPIKQLPSIPISRPPTRRDNLESWNKTIKQDKPIVYKQEKVLPFSEREQIQKQLTEKVYGTTQNFIQDEDALRIEQQLPLINRHIDDNDLNK